MGRQGKEGGQTAHQNPVPLVPNQQPESNLPEPDVLRTSGQEQGLVSRGFHQAYEVLEELLLPVEPQDATPGFRSPETRPAAESEGPTAEQGGHSHQAAGWEEGWCWCGTPENGSAHHWGPGNEARVHQYIEFCDQY